MIDYNIAMLILSIVLFAYMIKLVFKVSFKWPVKYDGSITLERGGLPEVTKEVPMPRCRRYHGIANAGMPVLLDEPKLKPQYLNDFGKAMTKEEAWKEVQSAMSPGNE